MKPFLSNEVIFVNILTPSKLFFFSYNIVFENFNLHRPNVKKNCYTIITNNFVLSNCLQLVTSFKLNYFQ